MVKIGVWAIYRVFEVSATDYTNLVSEELPGNAKGIILLDLSVVPDASSALRIRLDDKIIVDGEVPTTWSLNLPLIENEVFWGLVKKRWYYPYRRLTIDAKSLDGTAQKITISLVALYEYE